MRMRLFRLLPATFLLLWLLIVLVGCVALHEPTAILRIVIGACTAPAEVSFDLSFSTHSAGDPMTFELDFGDGSEPVRGSEFGIILRHTYETAGSYQAWLRVIDEDGRSDTDSRTVVVTAATVEIGIELCNEAPDFTGHTTEGGEIVLSDYRGNVVLIDFWGAWCTPCQKSMPHLDRLVTAYADQGLVAVIVSTDLVEQDAIDFLASGGYTQFISVWEPGGKNGNPIDALYDVALYPTTFVLDRQGVIRWIGHPLNLDEVIIEALL